MYSAVASGIFAVRNVNKTENGEVGRGPVAIGQTVGVLQEIAKYDGAIANSARSALSVFSDIAKQNKAFEYAGKFTKFAVNNVNPLICVSGALKTAMSDDKLQTGITEAGALGAMFAGEKLTKMHYEKLVKSDTCKNILNKLSKTKGIDKIFEYISKHKLEGKIGLVIKGLAFLTASITSYNIGENIGKNVAKDIKTELGLEKTNKINHKA